MEDPLESLVWLVSTIQTELSSNIPGKFPSNMNNSCSMSCFGSAFNLNPFVFASSLNIPRLFPGVTSGHPTEESKFIYAIGGSSNGSAVSSVEAAAVDRFGGLSNWTVLNQVLHPLRSFE